MEGPTGIGKSQIVAQYAKAAGLQMTVLDLSLLEPPDLIGLPVIEGDVTSYAAPAELPRSGKGILMLEELNRAEIPVMQPALQLLSARRLHSYELPPDWLCVAAINPEDGDYQVNRLDPALRSRFLQLSVRAEREEWLSWAAKAGIHPVISSVVRDHVDAFVHTAPRSWAYASDLLHSLRPDEASDGEFIRTGLRGYLPTPWALAAVEAFARAPVTPELDAEILFGAEGERELMRLVRDVESRNRMDAVAMISRRLCGLFRGPVFGARVLSGQMTLDSLERLVACLPGDLREQCLDAAVEVDAARKFLPQPPGPAELEVWKRDLKLHRIKLAARSYS
jgi:MoxR-like ATPase